MRVEVIEEGLRIKYVPTHEDLAECVQMGRRIGKEVLERNAQDNG
jgi:flavorubredoxin